MSAVQTSWRGYIIWCYQERPGGSWRAHWAKQGSDTYSAASITHERREQAQSHAHVQINRIIASEEGHTDER